MKRFLAIAVSSIFAASLSASSALAAQVIKLDFGRHDVTNGDATVNPDSFGHYWNNLSPSTAATSSNVAVNSTFGPFFTQDNQSTSVGIKMTSGTGTALGYWECNGKLNGGLLTPSSALLGDFAVPSVTEDYFFLAQGTAGIASVTLDITGLDASKTYSFRIFGTRDVNTTRTSKYTLTGLNSGSATLTTSGVGIGSSAHPNANDNTIVSINGIQPTAGGVVQTKLEVIAGSFAYLGAMEITETPEPASLAALGMAGVVAVSRKRRPA